MVCVREDAERGRFRPIASVVYGALMHARSGVLWLAAVVVALSGAAAAQDGWLASASRDALADQLIARLTAIEGRPPKAPDQAATNSRRFVDGVRGQIDRWTVRGVIDRSPVFDGITLPRTNDRHLAAMARYQFCSLVLLRQFEADGDPQARATAALGLTAVTLATLALRADVLAAGGTSERVEAFLTSPDMEREAGRLQRDPSRLRHVEDRCGPIVGELVKSGF